MNVLVTGASGFIGKNLILRFEEQNDVEVIPFRRGDTTKSLVNAIQASDAVIHLAGENRPSSPEAFETVNVGLTKLLCNALQEVGRKIPLLLSSSTQTALDNPYARSKLAAEELVSNLAHAHGNPVAIYRLPGVFGKWCKPNYNSVVATFCHNVAHDLPIEVHDTGKSIRLVYIDDVLDSFLDWIQSPGSGVHRPQVEPEYNTNLGEMARTINSFKNYRTSLVSERVGEGLIRALYSTYVSYLPKERFSYDIPTHGDARGLFVEVLKTPDAGQFSFFTAHPGVTRGEHYHHTKTEKFLVIKGMARFGFRHMLTNEKHVLETTGDKPQVVETIPGWAHNITNIGQDEMIVMLWANEIFDPTHPDTIASKV